MRVTLLVFAPLVQQVFTSRAQFDMRFHHPGPFRVQRSVNKLFLQRDDFGVRPVRLLNTTILAPSGQDMRANRRTALCI